VKKAHFAIVLSALTLLPWRAHASEGDIDLDVRAPGFDVEAVRAALSVDLARPVLPPTPNARVHLFVMEVDGALVVGIREGAREVTRRITLSNDPAIAQETLELVLAAMTRSESRTVAAAPAVAAPEHDDGPPTAPSTQPPSPQGPSGAPAGHEVAPTPEGDLVVPIAVDFAPFVGVSSVTHARETRYLSIGAVGSASRNLHGVSVDGAVGIATKRVDGLQVTGAVAYADTTDGAQIAGALNLTTTYLHGAQIAGAVNVVDGDVDGAQLAGAVNVATGHVRGLQLGVVNVADESDVPIGVFNFIKHGRHHLDIWGSEFGLVMGGVQLGGKYTHAIVGVGFRPGPEGTSFVVGAGLGVHFDVAENVGMDIDVLHHDLNAFSWQNTPQLSQLRLVLDLKVAPRVRFFAGPTFNVFVSNDPKDTNPAPFTSWSVGSPTTTHVALWPGLTVGGRLFD
jgi:hypothetical protein